MPWPGPPGHRDDAVAVLGAAIELAARVVVVDRLVHAVGQLHVAVADQPHRALRSAAVTACSSPACDGGVDRLDQLVAAGEVDVGQDAAFRVARSCDEAWSSGAGAWRVHVYKRREEVATAGPKRSMSTRNASWPCGEGSGRKSASAPPARRPSAICSCCCSGNRMSVATPIASAFSTRIVASAGRRRRARRGVFGQVEPVHRAAEVEVAVGIEAAHEAARVAFEVALDLELQPERILVVAAVRVQPHAAEAAVPFHRRAIGDHAELARHAHAGFGIVRVVVIAVVPGRIQADRFALQRADRDRERQRARRCRKC